MSRTITVAIPTRGDRPSLLDTLTSILRQDGAGFSGDVEVLVVWSGRVEPPAWGSTLPASVRQVTEAVPGVARARNVALHASGGRLVAFTDDDAWCRPGWLTALRKGWQEGATIVGGPVCVVWPRGMPRWVTPNAEAMFGLWAGDEPLELGAGGTLIGPNMAMDRERALSLGGFDERLGHGAGTRLMGEETDICRRAAVAGLRVLYDPRAVVEHRIEPRAATRRNYLWRMFRLGRTQAILDRPTSGGWSPAGRTLRGLVRASSSLVSARPTERMAEAAWLLGAAGGMAELRSSARMLSLMAGRELQGRLPPVEDSG